MSDAESKFGELLLYVATRLADDPLGGATKLNKVLFFSEFAHVRKHGAPITGVDYQKLPQGPAPRRLVPIREGLIAVGDARIENETFVGYTQKRLVALRAPNTAVFTEDELETVDGVIEQLWGMTAAQVSALSHEEAGWQMVDEGDTIPFEAAYLRRPVVTPHIRERAAELAAQRAG